MRRLTKEQTQALLADRQAGTTRNELALKYGLTLAGVKSILLRHKASLPLEQRQLNAYQAKLAKNPEAMKEMRKALTADTVARRSQSIRARYQTDEGLRALKGQQSRNWWSEYGPDSKYVWGDVSHVATQLGMSLSQELSGPVDTENVSVRCRCGLVWTPRVYDFLYGKIRSCGCVKSEPQAEIAKWVQELGYEVVSNDRTTINPFELDIVVPAKKLAIEYCGLAWHGEQRKELRRYHLNKLERAEAAGYRLVTIFADEWLDKPLAVRGYLLSILGQTQTKLGARHMDFSPVEWKAASGFLDAYHIQGAGAPLAHCYGLFFDGELLAVATFKPISATRRGRADDRMWELVRYCVKPHLQIVGGFDRVFRNFQKLHNPKVVTSYSDRRWSQGDLYRRAGFRLASTLPPSYWYFKKNTDRPRWHKSKFRKSSIGALPSETEWDVMQRLGYDRIWDCGLQKWILELDAGGIGPV